MRQKEQERLDEKLTDVRKIAASRLGKAENQTFGAALDRFFANVSPDQVVETSAEELYGAALALWKFSATRKPGAPKVRLYNPGMTEHGWESPHSVLEVVNDDMPFLVDSLTACLTERGIGIHTLLHPIIRVARDAKGVRKALAEKGDKDAMAESVIQAQVDQIGDDKMLAQTENDIRQVLADVRAAVDDWKPMMKRLADVTEALKAEAPKKIAAETKEDCEFLDWLAQNHFTFLGCREYKLNPGAKKGATLVKDSGLGLMRDPNYTVLRNAEGKFADWSPDMDAFVSDSSPLLILKANRRSTVHRTTHLDLIGIKRYDKKGAVTGEHVFVGHFTAAAYNRSPRAIPLLRQKVERIIARAGFGPNSHDGKALTNVLETYPRDELFQSNEDQLYRNAIGVLHLATRPRTRLFVRQDRFNRFLSCIAYVPRERYNTELRVRMGKILSDAFGGRVATWTTNFGDEALARTHFVIATTGGGAPDYDVAEVEARIVEAVRDWSDLLQEALIERKGEHEGNRLHARYHGGYSAAYRDFFNAVTAIDDIEKMEELSEESTIGLKFYRRLEDIDCAVRFKLFRFGGPVPLSDCLPVLEHMGFRILEEHPFNITRGEDEEIWLHDFYMESADGSDIELAEIREKLEEAFADVWSGTADDDPLNRLVLLAGLGARETMLLRAYSRFLRQARIPYSVEYMEDALADNPGIARALVALFHALFDPAGEAKDKDRAAKAEKIVGEIEEALEAVASLDVDRILRRFRNAIHATLRTNYYQPGAKGALKPYVSFKFKCDELDELPLPRPWREIFVYSTWIEGVHLRGGPVARGGLRWSDRKEDYRTEVLGLVKAQQVKNAVIVPVGSKGGFVVKRPPQGGDREAIQKEGISCYKSFISGLLDLTDNLDGAKVVPPRDVVRKDDDDPYLVVAADKGTATFSDIANGVAASYKFWLDDAFASGGSAGYDHKKMGITARGAWESVKRHFREFGKDIQNEDFTVVGVGDMSGDVFGNGMLLSKHIKLCAAFNHLHIFVDPDPDPAKSFKERQRLFRLPRSAWSDYDAKVISKGGAVFERSAKSLKLTPEIKSLLGISKDNVTPNELMTAILLADVDLLWFGGIGTYVKASTQSHADAGDRANDGIRVDGENLRAKVVGEGANLGVTQLGRIEYALGGGRINTDSVDNSAGVDCSDHEVNIKILLGTVEKAGKLSRKQRDKLLESMTDEVAELVLRDNYLQTGSLAVTEFVGARLTDRLGHFMRTLERAGHLNRAIEYLPDDEELADRKAKKLGFTNPELCILIAYAKIVLYDQLLASDFPDDPFMVADLERYFPEPLQKKYKAVIGTHRLRREIVATVATNSMINRAGIGFAHEVMERTGAEACDVARAYTISRTIFSMRDLWEAIEALDNKAPAAVQSEMHMETGRLIERATIWFLRFGKQPLDIAANIDAYGPGAQQLMKDLDKISTPSDHAFIHSQAEALVEKGAPHGLARKIASLRLLVSTCDIVMMARDTKSKIDNAGSLYFAVGDYFGFDWLRRGAGRLPIDSHWDKQATTAIIDDLYGHQFELASKVLKAAKPKMTPRKAIENWCSGRDVAYRATMQLMDDLRQGGATELAMLAVANRQLRSLISS